MAEATRFLISLFGVAPDPLREVFLTVVRAGRLAAGPDHVIERDYYPGHELIYCRSGKGWVKTRGKNHSVKAGQLAWVNCHHPHSYGADRKEPWEVDWIRVEGSNMDRVWKILSGEARPVFDELNGEKVVAEYEAIFGLMKVDTPVNAAWINVHTSTVLALCWESRQKHPISAMELLPPPVERTVQHMRLYYHKPLRISDLADVAGMSPSHFTRTFRSAVGSSPIDWLRHYRIQQAKRRLLESTDPVKDVARQVGYSDQFYFSKDFKRFTLLSPTVYRETEAGQKPSDSTE
ncbi:MAG: AraC family transcriptional regulator [Verrucomicrobiaceae bacterium]|nr:AraC family transcriptional regulator [Verrucomicrobiaceae bacterium]